MLRANQDIIKINKNVKTLVMAKEQYMLSKGNENPRGCSKPMAKPSTDKAYSAKQTAKSDDDA